MRRSSIRSSSVLNAIKVPTAFSTVHYHGLARAAIANATKRSFSARDRIQSGEQVPVDGAITSSKSD